MCDATQHQGVAAANAGAMGGAGGGWRRALERGCDVQVESESFAKCEMESLVRNAGAKFNFRARFQYQYMLGFCSIVGKKVTVKSWRRGLVLHIVPGIWKRISFQFPTGTRKFWTEPEVSRSFICCPSLQTCSCAAELWLLVAALAVMNREEGDLLSAILCVKENMFTFHVVVLMGE
jgi:hypothetical protein